MKPTIGRIVIYRSRTGDYDLPAIVTATTETLNPKGVEEGKVRALSNDNCVHLTVFTPGNPNSINLSHPEDAPGGALSQNVAGTYQEWNISPAPDPAGKEFGSGGQVWPPPGTWRWPVKV